MDNKLDIKMAYLPVVCISIRDTAPEQIQIGNEYFIDRLSIWIDRDGDAYGIVYDAKSNDQIGHMMLYHFRGK